LFDTLAETPSRRPEVAFRDRVAYGRPTREEGSERHVHAEMWRAAALRNFSVVAWRSLWRWMTRQLLAAMTLDELAQRLADELPDITVASLLTDLPDGTLAQAELEILKEKGTARPAPERNARPRGGDGIEPSNRRLLRPAGFEDRRLSGRFSLWERAPQGSPEPE
jgi:hypothetical protein